MTVASWQLLTATAEDWFVWASHPLMQDRVLSMAFRKPFRHMIAMSCLAGVVFASQANSASLGGNVAAGKAFARKNCARCHAIGRKGESPDKAAPPLRTLYKRYRLDSLSEAFAEGILVGHTNMPEFELDPAVITDLLAYIQSISEN